MSIKLDARSLLCSPAFWLLAAFGMLMFFGVNPAHAADASAGGGPGLPWEGPLDKLQRSLSGPVAFVVSMLGIFGGGATLIFGGEISEFARRMIYLVMVISVLVFANTLLTGTLFSGALIPNGGLFPDNGAVSPIEVAAQK